MHNGDDDDGAGSVLPTIPIVAPTDLARAQAGILSGGYNVDLIVQRRLFALDVPEICTPLSPGHTLFNRAGAVQACSTLAASPDLSRLNSSGVHARDRDG